MFVHAAAEREQSGVGDGVRIKPGGGVHQLRLVLVLEDVRQRQRADFAAAIEEAVARHEVQHKGAEAALCAMEMAILAREFQPRI